LDALAIGSSCLVHLVRSINPLDGANKVMVYVNCKQEGKNRSEKPDFPPIYGLDALITEVL
jgi:hypothetical protein